MKEIGYYRVEFKEDSQNWHLDRGNAVPNTNGWFTVIEHCDDFYFKFFENYIKRETQPYTKKYLLKSAKEVSNLMSNLQKAQIEINFQFIKQN
jgi:hypothetical protein